MGLPGDAKAPVRGGWLAPGQREGGLRREPMTRPGNSPRYTVPATATERTNVTAQGMGAGGQV